MSQPEEALEPESTRLESVEEIRWALKARKTPGQIKAVPAAEETTAFRPTRRPPIAHLCILDDGKEDGEWVRLRHDRVLLGRVEGDVVIPHDTMMSSRHAELSRRLDAGRCRWILTDLKSTNGTFVRVGSAVLKPNQELLLGSRCYRFEVPAAAGPAVGAKYAREIQASDTVDGWKGVTAGDLAPALVELTPEGEGRRFLLKQKENWIGGDAESCGLVIAADPFVSPRHARIFQDAKGKWSVENNKSINGIWLRVHKVPLEGTCLFQLGEQRFLFRDQ